MAGTYIHSLVVTDVDSGWTEALPLLVREQSLVTEGLTMLRRQFPVPIVGINSDNDSAFINETLRSYCEREGIAFTRSRAYRKNDQAHVEQKNGAVVRRMVGYGRYTGIAAATELARLYRSMRLYVNFFQPSFKLLEKTRDGARVSKRYHPPLTPFQLRMLAGTAALAWRVAIIDWLDPGCTKSLPEMVAEALDLAITGWAQSRIPAG